MKHPVLILSTLLSVSLLAQTDAPMGGIWTLNRSLSEFKADIGFNISWVPTPETGSQSGASAGGGRGRRGGSSGGGGGTARSGGDPFSARGESYDDSRRLQMLTSEVRNPPARMTVVDTAAAFTITNELGQSRTLHPDGRQEVIEIQGIPVSTTAKRDGDQIVVMYHVEKDRDLRYTFSRSASPPQLIVDVQFLEKGAGDKARRIYEPGLDPRTLTKTAAAPGSTAPGGKTPESFDQRPGAELKGLNSLGILVENLSSQATACGLEHNALESALSKRLKDAGFTVRTNSDEDTYVYVNLQTTRQSEGVCVTRYDAFLYTQATAKLSYHEQPVLVQVSLIHRGGIGSSAPVSHAAAVGKGLQDYVDLFITQIRDANK